MRKLGLNLLTFVSKKILPSYWNKDLTKLSKIDKGIVAFRYWLVLQILD